MLRALVMKSSGTVELNKTTNTVKMGQNKTKKMVIDEMSKYQTECTVCSCRNSSSKTYLIALGVPTQFLFNLLLYLNVFF